MVQLINERIVNYNSFRRECNPLFSDNLKTIPVIVSTPASNTVNTFNVNNFEYLVTEIIKQSHLLPHKKCILIYKINKDSNISLQIQPVVESA